MDALKKRLEELKEDRVKLLGEATETQTCISNLNNKLNQLTTRVTRIEGAIAEIEKLTNESSS